MTVMRRLDLKELLHLAPEEVLAIVRGAPSADLQEWWEFHKCECEFCREWVAAVQQIEMTPIEVLHGPVPNELLRLSERVREWLGAGSAAVDETNEATGAAAISQETQRFCMGTDSYRLIPLREALRTFKIEGLMLADLEDAIDRVATNPRDRDARFELHEGAVLVDLSRFRRIMAQGSTHGGGPIVELAASSDHQQRAPHGSSQRYRSVYTYAAEDSHFVVLSDREGNLVVGFENTWE